jgi:GDP-L-fucose synthase
VGKDSRIYVAGAHTLIGSALIRRLQTSNPGDEPDLTDAAQVEDYFSQHDFAHVYLAAGRSGGIAANQRNPADLMRDNLLVTLNVLDAAHRHRVRKLLYLASSCSYPRECSQPMREEDLLTGAVEPTSAAYATAKIAGIHLCQAYRQQYGCNFIVGIPANAFGPGDDFSPEDSHVIAALVRRMHEAKIECRDVVTIWGTGTPRREFIFADDLADACIHVMSHYSESAPINLGGGSDLSIRELAEQVAEIVGFAGRLEFDASRPDGAPLKALDGQRLAALGWRPRTSFRDALSRTYQAFLESFDPARLAHA